MAPMTLTNCYRCTRKTLLIGMLDFGFGFATALPMITWNCKQLQTQPSPSEKPASSLNQLHYILSCLWKVASITKDLLHSYHSLFFPLLSGRRYKCMSARSFRFRNCFSFAVIRLMRNIQFLLVLLNFSLQPWTEK